MPSQRTDTLKAPVSPGVTTTYTGTAGSITTQVIRGDTLMVWTTTDAWVTLGQTATTQNATPIPAFTPIFIPMPVNAPAGGGSGWSSGETQAVLVSAVQISAGGTLFAQQFA